MLRLLYSILLFSLLPLLVLRLFIKSLGVAGYRRRIGERFGSLPLPSDWDHDKQTIWIHAVSVGEVVASAPMIKALQQRSLNLVVTTTTPTGSDRVRTLFGDSLFHVYVPYDLGFLLNRFLSKLKPELLIIMETELWPNMLHHSKRHGVKVLLANARLSEKSAAGYRRFSGLTHSMLHNIDRIAAQADADAQRFSALGAQEGTVSVIGSLKFYTEEPGAANLDNPVFSSVAASGRPVLIAASTRDGEEQKVIAAYQQIKAANDDVLLLLIPRHPERFDKVADICAAAGFSVQLRSEDSELRSDTDVLLGDSMGEMNAYYQLATVAFVGGSLVDTGCQNVIEPAALALPVVVGPSQFNFATICEQLEQAGALQTVQNSDGLAVAVNQLLSDPNQRHQMGAAGQALVKANQQALPLLIGSIDALLRN